ncbi:hypothetical protein FIV42_12335 [Persicimonas caeni]|uniref:Peptidase C-terminal archaeal/bacterial domain-containing protein n=1 Tax=Persicimonas caeni TaxID=2292766 RepID=A0A4Y6PT45_PERCE|nr:PPC domain-containing protein [Persicimonas caeni]QDG51504.1 hypothetical protein FIV42_12335 [Persicimonas caeni]QED32725.1 hypothetical protein FRD00_12330 [Persicimonas caeni]
MRTRRLSLLLALFVALLATFSASCGADAPPNEAPSLTLSVGSEETYVVGEDVVQIQVTAKDPEGGNVSFDVINRPSRAEFQTFASSALFSWDPITSDVTEDEPLRLIFVATDSQGASTERVVNLTIHAGNGTPRFLTASSKLYDPNSNKPLEFEVEVRDDDSRDVDLQMPADKAPAGASFEQTGPKIGTFTWSPSVQQRDKRVHSVTFVADDRQTEPVTLKVSIILQNGGGGGGTTDPDPVGSCEGEQPIAHDPLGAQRTIEDYEVEATFSSTAAAKYDLAYLFWSTDDVMNQEVEWGSTEMKIDGTELRGAIPNLLLPAGESQTVYYSICAMDEDAAEDAEDAFICAPGGSYFTFNAYSPDETACLDDAAGASFGSATPIPDDVWAEQTVCSGTADFHQFTVEAGEIVDLYVTYSLGQDVDVKLYDDAEKQRDLVEFSECYGVAYIPLEAPESGQKTWFVEVTGADAPYQITAWRQQGGGGTCGDEANEPNDTAADATLVFDEIALFEGAAICTEDDVDIYAFDVLAGDTVDALLEFIHADGDLDMTLYAPSQSDNVSMDSFGVADAWSTNDDEELSHVAQESGIYHLLVMSSDTPNTYDLTISKTCGDDDTFGTSNHSQSSPALITPGTYSDLKMCAGQPDWYERTGFADQVVLAEVVVQQGARVSDVEFSVWDANGLIDSATVNGDRLELEFTPTTQAQYFYKVSGPSSMIYELTYLD